MIDDCAGSLWNEDRDSLYRLLEQLNPTLAGLYRMSIMLLDESPHCWEDKARLSLVGHCFRELMNRFPDWLQDVDGVPANSRPEENRSLDLLLAAYVSYRGEPIDQPAPAEPEALQQPDFVPVPRDLMDALARFITAREKGTCNERDRDAATVLGGVGVSSPALGPWRQARKFFMSCTHLNLQYAAEEQIGTRRPSDVAMRHVDTVEATLRVRLGRFFDSYKEIEDIVSSANELDDVETSEP